MRALVTGGCGFIGSALVRRLWADGCEVVVVDDLSTGTADRLDEQLRSGRVRLEQLDVTEPALLGTVTAARPDVVFHLAAQTSVRVSVEDPVTDARVNILGSLAVAGAAHAAGCRRMVFTSSGGTVYGELPPTAPACREDAPERRTSPYGVAKRSVDGYLMALHVLCGLDVVSLRLGNVYGPGQDSRGEAGVVAVLCERLLSGDPVVVYGDGRQTRDYVYVDDVVEVLVRAALAPTPLVAGRCLNVGTGVETDVLSLYGLLRQVTGRGGEVVSVLRRPGELQRVSLDVRQVRETLGWRASTSLSEGLRRTWSWARARHRQPGTSAARTRSLRVHP